MNFLPPIPIPADIIRGYAGDGAGIAVNADGTLFASVDFFQSCVYIYNAADRTTDPVVVGTAGTAGNAHGRLHCPVSVCFVHHDGIDTLLICDFCNDRVVEVTVRGEFMRAIAVSRPWGIAERDGVIAVSLWAHHAVVLLQYESGAVKLDVTSGSGTAGNADGELHYPRGVTFATDGCHILVADCGNHRASKFSAASGAFIAHVISNGIRYPTDVLQCEDGSMVVVHEEGVASVGKDGVTVQSIDVRDAGGGPSALSYSPSLNGVVVKCRGGDMFVLRDAWSHSLRCTWVHACVRV
jgi:DNA-binding beta-propeller fold protein YncE